MTEPAADAAPPHSLRVLIVEDDENDAELMLREIRRGGWEPTHARVQDAEGMRSALAAEVWDLILSDFRMPQFNGLEAAKILRESELDIPLIIVSGAIGEESAVGALKAGAADFISKGALSRLNPAIERELREAAGRRELREAGRRLSESEERLRLLIDGVEDYAIFMLDAEGRVLSWNSGAQRILGYTESEILGQPLATFFAPDDRRNGLPERQIEKVRKHGRFEGEEWHLRKDGSFIWTHVVNSPLRGPLGEVVGFCKVVRDVTKQKLVEDELNRSAAQIRNLSEHLQTVREEERTEIAREIHDELGQLLTVLKFDLARIAKKPPESPGALRDNLRPVIETVDRAIQTTRKIVTELRPGILDDSGLIAAIEWHAQEFEKRTGLRCDVILPSRTVPLDRARSTALFRIFQEILTNVAKHSGATSVDVVMTDDEQHILLEVRDNGTGIRPEAMAKENSFGLTGMRERLRKFGGRLEITGRPGQGTTVTVEIPVE